MRHQVSPRDGRASSALTYLGQSRFRVQSKALCVRCDQASEAVCHGSVHRYRAASWSARFGAMLEMQRQSTKIIADLHEQNAGLREELQKRGAVSNLSHWSATILRMASVAAHQSIGRKRVNHDRTREVGTHEVVRKRGDGTARVGRELERHSVWSRPWLFRQ